MLIVKSCSQYFTLRNSSNLTTDPQRKYCSYPHFTDKAEAREADRLAQGYTARPEFDPGSDFRNGAFNLYSILLLKQESVLPIAILP